MKKIAILGNSHAAALAHGWHTLEDQRREQVTFFTAPRDRMNTLRPENGVLVTDDEPARLMIARSSGGDGSVDLRPFDEIWLVGLGTTIRRVMNAYAGWYTDRMAADVDRIGISHRAFENAIIGNSRRAAMLAVASIVREVSDAPIRCIPEPLPSQLVAENGEQGGPWRLVEKFGDQAELLAIYETATAEVLAPIGTLQMQPESTTTADGFHTERAYAQTPSRLKLDPKLTKPDGFHMNADYGRQVLLAGLGAETAPQPLLQPSP